MLILSRNIMSGNCCAAPIDVEREAGTTSSLPVASTEDYDSPEELSENESSALSFRRSAAPSPEPRDYYLNERAEVSNLGAVGTVRVRSPILTQ